MSYNLASTRRGGIRPRHTHRAAARLFLLAVSPLAWSQPSELGPVSQLFDVPANLPLPQLILNDHGNPGDDQPLAQAGTIGANWKAIEPHPGIYDWSSLDDALEYWAALGKPAVLRFAPYMGKASDARESGYPDWLDGAGVQFVAFEDKQGAEFEIPLTWGSAGQEWRTQYAGFVAAVAQRYGDDPRVGLVWIGVGHLGQITCQPSDDSSAALIAAGWNTDDWLEYSRWCIGTFVEAFGAQRCLLGATTVLTNFCLGDDSAPIVAEALDFATALGCGALLSGIEQTDAMQGVVDCLTVSPAWLIVMEDWPIRDVQAAAAAALRWMRQLGTWRAAWVMLPEDLAALIDPDNLAAVESVVGELP